jgi:hypothetical protein
MDMINAPRPPVKRFLVLRPYGPYSKGSIIQPTGIFRDVLLRKGVIELIKEDPAHPLADRQIPEQELFNRAPATARTAGRKGR